MATAAHPLPQLPLWPQPRPAHAPVAPHYDYCLLPYEPQTTTPDDLLSVNLLRWSWDAHGVLAEGEALLQRLREGLGANQVVWGIKQREGQPDATSWELYFYRRPHNPPDYTLAHVAELFKPLHVEGAIPAHWAWLMFSIELDVHQLRGARPCTSSAYLASSGLSYKLRADAPPELENHYLFRDPLAGIDDILASAGVGPCATASARLGSALAAAVHALSAHLRGQQTPSGRGLLVACGHSSTRILPAAPRLAGTAAGQAACPSAAVRAPAVGSRRRLPVDARGR